MCPFELLVALVIFTMNVHLGCWNYWFSHQNSFPLLLHCVLHVSGLFNTSYHAYVFFFLFFFFKYMLADSFKGIFWETFWLFHVAKIAQSFPSKVLSLDCKVIIAVLLERHLIFSCIVTWNIEKLHSQKCTISTLWCIWSAPCLGTNLMQLSS